MITVICKQSNKCIIKCEYGGKMKYIHNCLKYINDNHLSIGKRTHDNFKR